MSKALYKRFILLVFLTGVTIFTNAEILVQKKLYDFSQNWLRYDKYYESYLPIKNSALRNEKSIHQIISLAKYKGGELSFSATNGLSLFVNNKLLYKKVDGKEEIVLLPLTIFEPDSRGEVIITFYHSKADLPIYTASIIRKVVKQNNTEEVNNYSILVRHGNNKLAYFFILFLFIVVVFVLFKQMYPKEFMRYYSFKFQENSDHLLPGTFGIPSILMAFINSLIIALLIYVLNLDVVLFNSSTSLFKGILYTVFFYSLFFIGKYFYLHSIAWLFNYTKIVANQFSAYFRFFEISCLLIAFIVFGVLASGVTLIDIKPEILYYSLIIVLIIGVVKVIFLFFRLISHRNLYLFSYICAAEILPLIIAIKILLF